MTSTKERNTDGNFRHPTMLTGSYQQTVRTARIRPTFSDSRKQKGKLRLVSTLVTNVPYLMVSFTGSGDPLTSIRNSSSKCPRMVELKEICTAWTPLGSMMPSLGLKTKQAPRAEVGGITLKRASMLPLLDRIACANQSQRWSGQGNCTQFSSKYMMSYSASGETAGIIMKGNSQEKWILWYPEWLKIRLLSHRSFYTFSVLFKIQLVGARVIARRLKVHTALIEHPSSGPRIISSGSGPSVTPALMPTDFTGTYTTGTYSPPTHTNNLKI